MSDVLSVDAFADLRVVDLADEFGISISETLSLCELFGIDARYGSSKLSAEDGDYLRGVASGAIDPDEDRTVAAPTPVAVGASSAPTAGAAAAAPPATPVHEKAAAAVGAPPTPKRPVDATPQADRRSKPSERRVETRRTEDRKDYQPGKPLAEYDDIDKYVPKWLKYVFLGAVLVFGVLVWRLFFGGDTEAGDSVDLNSSPTFAIGECFLADPALWIDTISVVSCDGEHDGEIFATNVVAGDLDAPYPDPEQMRSTSRTVCRAEFAAYTGESSVASRFGIGVSIPSSIEWSNGDRVVYCSIIDPGGAQLTGSASANAG